MQRFALSAARRSIFPVLYAVSSSQGMRFSGQCAMHFPQRMQADAVGSAASAAVMARMAFVFLRIGCSRSGTAMPIIGPP